MEKYELTEERVYFVMNILEKELEALEEHVETKLKLCKGYIDTLKYNIGNKEE